ncbi:MAG: VOC family protein [Bacteroidota bacterium]
MTQIRSYLTFNGNCREAMNFYKNCLGGELSFQSIGESPLADKMPAPMKESILHATLVNDTIVLMGSDMVGEQGLLKGNAVSLLLDCNNEEEMKNFYARLSKGGEATHPPAISFWGAAFGGLTDRFGNHWLLHFDNTAEK